MLTENVIVKDWRKIEFSFGLIYPNKISVGMSSYSIRLLYFLINSNVNIACERIFLPDDLLLKFPASKDYSSKNVLRSLENRVLPNEFDILGFSIHFENDFKNVLWIIDKAEVPLTTLERQDGILKDNSKYPILIAGGPAVTSNPIPYSKFFDILFIGDSEQNLPIFFDLFQNYNERKINYKEFLTRAKNIEGLFIPLLENKVKRSVLKNLDESPTPIFQLISSFPSKKHIFESNFFLEINRGCPFQCKFCISSFHNYPFRNRSYENIINSIQESIQYSNYETISLIGSCVSSHPKFKQICEYIIDKGKRLTIPSIRVEHLTQDIIKVFEKAEIKTITIAPEAGSEIMRYKLGKKISNEQIISTLTLIKDSQIKNVKFYFLIGLPNETERDIEAIISLLKSIDQLGFPKNSLRVNINPFIPKLNTPYQKEISFFLDDKISEYQRKYQKLEQELKNISSIKLKFKNFKSIIKNARLQTLISLGNQQVSNLLLQYYNNGASLVGLQKAEKDLNFSLNSYLLKIKECYSPWTI
ncbi:MAG: B12-binding domain-containing radical SAM protein [Candidatus Thorarchaeota archaeon]